MFLNKTKLGIGLSVDSQRGKLGNGLKEHNLKVVEYFKKVV